MNDIALQCDKVSVTFGALRAIEDFSYAFETGRVYGLIGPNGAGKTTLLNVLAGHLPGHGGSILCHGTDISRLRAYERVRYGIGRSFQQTSAFARLSVFDNLRCAALHAPAERRRWWNRLRESASVDLAAARVLHDIGLDARRDTLAGELGYAEQRALDLGIALASGARTLLLDEPTAGMNREQAARMIALIRATTQGRTVLMIEHDMDAVFGFAERITVLVRGTVVATGAPDAIRADPAVRRAYLGEHA